MAAPMMSRQKVVGARSPGPLPRAARLGEASGGTSSLINPEAVEAVRAAARAQASARAP